MHKKRIFYGQTDRKSWAPPALTVRFSWIFLCVQKKRCFLLQKTVLNPISRSKFSHLLTARAAPCSRPCSLEEQYFKCGIFGGYDTAQRLASNPEAPVLARGVSVFLRGFQFSALKEGPVSKCKFIWSHSKAPIVSFLQLYNWPRSKNAQTHGAWRARGKQYICKTCNKSLQTRARLFHHEKSHSFKGLFEGPHKKDACCERGRLDVCGKKNRKQQVTTSA